MDRYGTDTPVILASTAAPVKQLTANGPAHLPGPLVGQYTTEAQDAAPSAATAGSALPDQVLWGDTSASGAFASGSGSNANKLSARAIRASTSSHSNTSLRIRRQFTAVKQSITVPSHALLHGHDFTTAAVGAAVRCCPRRERRSSAKPSLRRRGSSSGTRRIT